MTAEDLLAGLLLEEPGRVAQLEGRLELEDLQDSQVQQLVGWLLERWRTQAVPSDYRELVNRFSRGSGNWENRMARWLSWVDSVVEKERTLDEVLDRIRESRRRSSLEGLQTAIRQAEQGGDEATVVGLIAEYNRLMKVKILSKVEG